MKNFRKAIRKRKELGQQHLVLISEVGLIRALLLKGDLDSVAASIEPILNSLQGLDGLNTDVIRMYLTCVEALRTIQDPRADQFQKLAIRILKQEAQKIPDPEMRRSYLENVPWNRQILSLESQSN